MNTRTLAVLVLLSAVMACPAGEPYVVAKRRLFGGTYRFEVATMSQYAELAERVRRENKALPTALEALKEKWRAENKIERKKSGWDKVRGRGHGRKGKKHEVSKPFNFDAPRSQTISREGPFRESATAEKRKAELEAADAKNRERAESFAAHKLEAMSERARESYVRAQQQQDAHMKGLLEQIDAILAGKGPKDNARRLGGEIGGSIDKTPSRLTSGSIKEFKKPDPKLVLTHVKGKGKKK